jgi:hypothetical protein
LPHLQPILLGSSNPGGCVASVTYRKLKIINDPYITEKTTHSEHHTLLSASTLETVCLHACVCPHRHRHSNAEASKQRDGREHGVKDVPYILNVITRWGQVVCFTQIRILLAPLSTGEKAG